MGYWNKLLAPLAKSPARTPATPTITPTASGLLTIGTTTYINPAGSYPIYHAADGTLTTIVNDTDHPITIVTERDHSPPPADIVLAPGERTETGRGDCVQVG
ncbi:hypothetical protein GCM10010211_21290 [Streptomyces albospinus]|uniref:Uncharacterized protein n=1 Tax=Streptomyces albospinus TaxID=285515 RepID=A0ABQ2UZT6_9ACTN|nr:hypothetical protein [Streptomyces albospinus]GGU56184.1 hypothetical protein GCM10010211_21290 [Streptomyces albospinus]